MVYTFTVGKENYKINADTMLDAMETMNRTVMDKICDSSWMWMDTTDPTRFTAAMGGVWD